MPHPDLDGTLYAIENGYEHACRGRVFQFMVDELGFADVHSAELAWRPQFQKYNQTLRALRAGLGCTVDAEKYWTYTRGDPGDVLRRNEDALEVLETVSARRGSAAMERGDGGGKKRKKLILTNCAEKQARECLAVLGLDQAFDAV